MTPDEREKLCEKYKLDVIWHSNENLWSVSSEDDDTGLLLSESTYRDVAIDLAADRLAERGMI